MKHKKNQRSKAQFTILILLFSRSASVLIGDAALLLEHTPPILLKDSMDYKTRVVASHTSMRVLRGQVR
jgi:hypothetical protein